MLDLGFLEPIRKIVAQAADASARTCSSRPPCRATSPSWPARSCAIRPRCASPRRRPRSSGSTSASSTSRPTASATSCSTCSRPRDVSRALVFTRTKRGADRLAKYLDAGRRRGRRHPRRQEPGPARTRPGRVQGRPRQGADRHRHRRARHRRRRGQPRVQLRTAERAGGLRPPHRPHRPRRRPRASPSASATGAERGLLRDIEKLTRLAIPAEDRRSGVRTPLAASSDQRPSPGGAKKSRRRRGGRSGPRPAAHRLCRRAFPSAAANGTGVPQSSRAARSPPPGGAGWAGRCPIDRSQLTTAGAGRRSSVGPTAGVLP